MNTSRSSALLSIRRTALKSVATVAVAASVLAVASPAHAATGAVGTHYLSSATCNRISSPMEARSDTINVKAPTIYAANVTSGQDAGFVGFRQRLVKWNGSAWVAVTQTAVYKGFATDSRAALDFQDPQGRTFRMPAFDLTAGKGYFAVVTDYFWYSTNTTAGGSNVATAHHSNNNPTGYCTFQY